MSFQSKYQHDAAGSVGLLFIRTYNIWHAQIKTALSKIDITHPQYIVMASLSYLSLNNQMVTQVQIANVANMDVMTTSQVLRALEKKSWVKRTPHPNDTRANVVTITAKGQSVVNQATQLVEAIDEAFFGRLNQDKDKLMQLLQKLISK